MSQITDPPQIVLIPLRENIIEITAHQHKIGRTDIHVMFNLSHFDSLFYLQIDVMSDDHAFVCLLVIVVIADSVVVIT